VSTVPGLDPTRTALLVMDYQSTILASLPGGEDRDALLGRVEGASADVRANGGTIAYVRVGFTEADWAAIPAGNKSFAPLAQHHVMHHEDPAAAIHERLAPQDGDIVVRKIRYGGMSTTDLDQRLRERGITTLVVSGISTSGGAHPLGHAVRGRVQRRVGAGAGDGPPHAGLGLPVLPDQVRGDPVEPGSRVRTALVVGPTSPERDQERLGHQIVGQVRAEPTGDVAVDRWCVPLVQGGEQLGVANRRRDDHRVGRPSHIRVYHRAPFSVGACQPLLA
jgi:Isochorismatase family